MKFILSKVTDIPKLFTWLAEICLSLDFSRPQEVGVKPVEDPRSTAQNNLYRLWLRELERVTGYHNETWNITFRKWFLGYEELQTTTGETVELLISTTSLSKKKFSEYLNTIENWVISEGPGITLPHPEDYARAMGKKHE